MAATICTAPDRPSTSAAIPPAAHPRRSPDPVSMPDPLPRSTTRSPDCRRRLVTAGLPDRRSPAPESRPPAIPETLRPTAVPCGPSRAASGRPGPRTRSTVPDSRRRTRGQAEIRTATAPRRSASSLRAAPTHPPSSGHRGRGSAGRAVLARLPHVAKVLDVDVHPRPAHGPVDQQAVQEIGGTFAPGTGSRPAPGGPCRTAPRRRGPDRSPNSVAVTSSGVRAQVTSAEIVSARSASRAPSGASRVSPAASVSSVNGVGANNRGRPTPAASIRHLPGPAQTAAD